MVESILVASGLTASAVGLWRGYASAREALGPLVHEGEPTRSLVEGSLPLHRRSRMRLFARRVLIATGWVVVALYGALLATVGLEGPR